jgi:pimeloyl-ACP methyl ester carboxylesterase
MPVISIRGVDIRYEVLGEHGPFVALQPGGRRAGTSVKPLAAKIAEAGYRVVVYDRRNCGASGSTMVSPCPMIALGDLWKALIGAGALRVPSSM